MKTLYLIGGTMGVGKAYGKSAAEKRSANVSFLDGDWC